MQIGPQFADVEVDVTDISSRVLLDPCGWEPNL